MGFCRCGPNNLDVGQKCKECGYVIPDKKYERRHFWGALVGAAIWAVIIFWLGFKFVGVTGWLVLVVFVAILIPFHMFNCMGPYYDGEALWEEPGPDGLECDEL